MAVSSKDRIEANALKNQYAQVLRILVDKRGHVNDLLLEIKQETGVSVRLDVEYVFTNEPNEPRQSDPAFRNYESRLKKALFLSRKMSAYSDWELSKSEFQKIRQDFQIHTLLVVNSAPIALLEAETGLSKPGVDENSDEFLRWLQTTAME